MDDNSTRVSRLDRDAAIDDLQWLGDELRMNFRAMLRDLKTRLEANYHRSATRLLAYFSEALEEEDPEIRKIAMKGLKKIRKKYPSIQLQG